jgi:signal transduction histidine kinase
MGLSICQRIAHCLNGTINVYSSVGSGTKMTLMLRLGADDVEDFEIVKGSIKRINS